MIDSMNSIKTFFPDRIAANKSYESHMLKEYIQCQILEYISKQPEAVNMDFIGGSNLRIVHDINRFSEDLDFDCKDMNSDMFEILTERIYRFLNDSGYHVIARDAESDKITAIRKSIYFPELLFSLGISGYRQQKFLLKIEMQDQGVTYPSKTEFINRCGFVFPLRTAPIDTLCAMKVNTVLTRGKGRDYYDLMFLLQRTKPDFYYLEIKAGIANWHQMIARLTDVAEETNLFHKSRDFEHLLFDKNDAKRILLFREFIKNLAA